MTIPSSPPAPALNGKAFPQVLSTKTSKLTSASTDHTVDMPTTVNSGDLLVAMVALGGASTGIWTGTGFTNFFAKGAGIPPGTAMNFEMGYKYADGTEGGGNIVVGSAAALLSSHMVYRITGHINPTTQAPEPSSGSASGSTVVNPDSLTPSGGARKYLWLAIAGLDGDVTVSSFPSNYSNTLSITSTTVSGTGVAGCERQLRAISENPDVFEISSSEDTVGVTLAIYPR